MKTSEMTGIISRIVNALGQEKGRLSYFWYQSWTSSGKTFRMRTKRFLFSTSLFVVFLVVAVFAQVSPAPSANLALTPPMGWNSWNKFACNVSEDMIKNMADAVVKSGMKDAGYIYVNIDDCWQVSRDSSGNIVADPQRFPHGMKAVGDYIHSLGLKFGVYSDAGSKT